MGIILYRKSSTSQVQLVLHVLELELELNNELEHEPKAVGPQWRRVGLQ